MTNFIENKKDYISNHIPYLNFGSESSNLINKEFIKPKIDLFFNFKGVKNYSPISNHNHISDLDFNKNIEFSYFYDFILNDLDKDTSGEFTISTKYQIILDKQACPIKCDKSNIFYNEIKVFDTTLMYLIFIDIVDIMIFIRNR